MTIVEADNPALGTRTPQEREFEKLRYFQTRWRTLQNERSSIDAHWSDIAKNVNPRAIRLDSTDETQGDRGRKKHQHIINGTPLLALRTLVSGLMAGATPPSRLWGLLTVGDEELRRDHAAQQWLQDATEIVHWALRQSRAYRMLAMIYDQLGTFGTGVAIMDYDDERVVKFTSLAAGEYVLQEDAHGKVNTCYRMLRMTVGQMVDEFGIEACSQSVQTMAKNRQLDRLVRVVHAIEPRHHRNIDSPLVEDMPFVSVYFEDGAPSKVEGVPQQVLRESGFMLFPVLAPRWKVLPNEAYGGSPAMDALGDIKQLQHQERTKAKALAQLVDPALQIPASIKDREVSALPGARTSVADTGANSGVRRMFEAELRIAELDADIQRIEQRILSHFYADLFTLFSNTDRRQMTAAEVAARDEEKLLQLGPLYENLQSELYSPLFEFVVDGCFRLNMFPPLPESLSGVELDIEYQSIIAQAQRSVGVVATDRFLTTVAGIAGVRPEAADKLAADEAVDYYADALQVPKRLVVPTDEVAAIREARARMQAAQDQAEALATTAKAARDAGASGAALPPDLIAPPSPSVPQPLPGFDSPQPQIGL